MSNVVTPAQVEKRLYDLSKELDEVQKDLIDAEDVYFHTKAQYEYELANTRLTYASKSAPNGKNYTIQERDDLAIVQNKDLHFKMAAAEAVVRATRSRAATIARQVDIARSIGTSVRAAVDIA